MQRMAQARARIAIPPAERLVVSTKTSAGTSREHVTIWQSSSNAVGWRQAGVATPALHMDGGFLLGERVFSLFVIEANTAPSDMPRFIR
jgi:hypothetical protein